MPLYMDRHDLAGVTAVDIAAAHLKDLDVQGRFGVQFLNYWFDYDRQHAFCLAEGPNREAVEGVHRESHGMVPTVVSEVDEDVVRRFMGGITEHRPGEPYVETAFRTIIFTDIEGSTSLTQRLGDARAMGVLRVHDDIVRSALRRNRGSEVKHTGDGFMAAFQSVGAALATAIEIQEGVAQPDAGDGTPLRVRIGIAAGEPVTEGGDLFGAAVQQAARLCQRAKPGTILASAGVHDLALGKGFAFGKGSRLRLKGFDDPMTVFEVLWPAAPVTELARPT